MLVIDPARRLSMREIITHKWMKMDGEDEEFNKLIQVLWNLCYRERDEEQWVLICCTEMFTLVRDRERNQDPSFSVVLVQFPVPVLVPRSVNKS